MRIPLSNWPSLPRRAVHKARSILMSAEFALGERRYNAGRGLDPGLAPRLHEIPRRGPVAGLPPAPPVRSYGFGPEHVEHDWADFAVREGDPGCLFAEDLFYLPGGNADWHKSGLYDGEGNPVPDTLVHHGTTLMNGQDRAMPARDAIVTEEREMIYIGAIRSFGHFISETMALLRVNESLDRPDALFLFHGMHPAATGWSRQFIDAAGIAPERFVSFDRPTRLRRVIVPRQAIVLNNSVWSAATDYTAAIGRRAMGTAGIERTDQPLYLSRSRVHISRRKLANERALEAWLEGRGVRIYRPEAHPLVEQIRTVGAHRTVIGPFGGAQFLSLFSQDPSRNIYFSSMLSPETYMMIDNVKGSESIWILTPEMDTYLKRGEGMHIRNAVIDLPFTQAVLKDLGI